MISAWKHVSASVVALGLLVPAASPAWAASNPVHSVAPASTPQEEQKAAEREAKEYEDKGRAKAQAQIDSTLGMARNFESRALSTKNSAIAAYSKSRTMTNFRRVTQTTAAHTQAVAIRKAIVGAANSQFALEISAVGKAAPMIVYPANALVMLNAWGVPPVCADPYMEAVRNSVYQAIDQLESLPATTRSDFENAVKGYQTSLSVVYAPEIAARNKYESARRAYAANPTPGTKDAMKAAKIERDGVIRVAKYEARDARILFTQQRNAIAGEGKTAINRIVNTERVLAREHGAALEKCMAAKT